MTHNNLVSSGIQSNTVHTSVHCTKWAKSISAVDEKHNVAMLRKSLQQEVHDGWSEWGTVRREVFLVLGEVHHFSIVLVTRDVGSGNVCKPENNKDGVISVGS